MQIFQERNVGLHPAHAKLAQRPVHPMDRLLERVAKRGDLHQQRIEIGRDHRAAERRAAIQPMPKPAGGSIARQPPVIRNEMILRVFRRDPRTGSQTRASNLFLLRNQNRRLVQLVTLGDQIWLLTMSSPVTTSVTVCSTWMRGFTSMK